MMPGRTLVGEDHNKLQVETLGICRLPKDNTDHAFVELYVNRGTAIPADRMTCISG